MTENSGWRLKNARRNDRKVLCKAFNWAHCYPASRWNGRIRHIVSYQSFNIRVFWGQSWAESNRLISNALAEVKEL
jgi:hypothetical protein